MVAVGSPAVVDEAEEVDDADDDEEAPLVELALGSAVVDDALDVPVAEVVAAVELALSSPAQAVTRAQAEARASAGRRSVPSILRVSAPRRAAASAYGGRALAKG